MFSGAGVSQKSGGDLPSVPPKSKTLTRGAEEDNNRRRAGSLLDLARARV
jgi:hypothetical protein